MDVSCAEPLHAFAYLFDVDFVAVGYDGFGGFQTYLFNVRQFVFRGFERVFRRAEMFDKPHCGYRADLRN